MTLRYLSRYVHKTALKKKRDSRKIKVTYKGKTTTCSYNSGCK